MIDVHFKEINMKDKDYKQECDDILLSRGKSDNKEDHYKFASVEDFMWLYHKKVKELEIE